MAVSLGPATGRADGTDITDTAGTARVTPRRRLALRLSPAAQRHGLGLAMALAALVLLAWDLGRPALWLDESASSVAVQRSWPDLLTLVRGSDSPLVPFYALLKVLTTASVQVFGPSSEQVEVLLRWPSVAAAVIGVWVFTVWLARLCPAPVVLGAGVFLLSSAGFSRYGQEARPYAIVMLFAITATALWTRLALETSPGRQRLWTAGYALALVLMMAANTLSGMLLAAHLVASLVAPDRGRRVRALCSTIAAGAIGLAVIEPLTVVMALHGGGATRFPAFDATALTSSLITLVTISPGRLLGIGALLPLALLGLTRIFDAEYRFVARLAAAWALIPPLLWVCAVALRPNLLIGRYTLFALPGWAILGGLGTATLFELVKLGTPMITAAAARCFRATRHLGSSRKAGTAWALGPGWALGTAWALTVVLLGAVVATQLPSLQVPRLTDGHGEDIRPAVALIDLPRYQYLPILAGSRSAALELGAYSRRDDSRLIGMRVQRNLKFIWPSVLPPDIRRFQLRAAPRLILLMRTFVSGDCSNATFEQNVAALYRCMPPVLEQMHYHEVTLYQAGKKWTFVVLYRGGEPPATPRQSRAGR